MKRTKVNEKEPEGFARGNYNIHTTQADIALIRSWAANGNSMSTFIARSSREKAKSQYSSS